MLVLTGICPKKIDPRKKIFDIFFLNVRKIFFNPLNGSLTEFFLATGGGVGGRSTKTFSLQGVVEFRRAILADTPPQLKGASFAPDNYACFHTNNTYKIVLIEESIKWCVKGQFR